MDKNGNGHHGQDKEAFPIDLACVNIPLFLSFVSRGGASYYYYYYY